MPAEAAARWKVDGQRKGAKEGGARVKEKYAERLAAYLLQEGLLPSPPKWNSNLQTAEVTRRRMLHFAMALAGAVLGEKLVYLDERALAFVFGSGNRCGRVSPFLSSTLPSPNRDLINHG